MYTMLIGRPPFETNDVKTTYKRIKMNAYSFPEGIKISPESRDLIENILVTDPTSRPSLTEIEDHQFFVKNLIPKLLPTSTLAVPPTAIYMRQFEKNSRPVSRGRDNSTGKLPRSNSNKDIERSTNKKNISRGVSRERASSREKNHSGSGTTTKKNATTSLYIPIPEGPQIWIKKWVDYSNKYGIGYMLSNGCAGVYFNDSTKMVADKEGTLFQYLSKVDHSKDDELTEHKFSNYPPEFQKKVTLLLHFRKHLEIDDKTEFIENPLTYVKK